MNKSYFFVSLLAMICLFSGCQSISGNVGKVQSFVFSQMEADWIRNGEPIKFEGELWYPGDGIEIFLDSEVYKVGTYRNVEFFVDRLDVRPYDRLYTKFGKNKFRYYEKRNQK